jgi:hypothetical protein
MSIEKRGARFKGDQKYNSVPSFKVPVPIGPEFALPTGKNAMSRPSTRSSKRGKDSREGSGDFEFRILEFPILVTSVSRRSSKIGLELTLDFSGPSNPERDLTEPRGWIGENILTDLKGEIQIMPGMSALL